eukprot:TRINITY_DN491_c0_g1_i3.p2 TRINITY_DN491_c0_g1~~TRINITY_DN491_c0_g1_i3.p2  ORF type:complete len:138 (-),score=15.95 TRINITY_DN491_c0_g1_i3:508-921(-)
MFATVASGASASRSTTGPRRGERGVRERPRGSAEGDRDRDRERDRRDLRGLGLRVCVRRLFGDRERDAEREREGERDAERDRLRPRSDLRSDLLGDLDRLRLFERRRSRDRERERERERDFFSPGQLRAMWLSEWQW